MGQHDSLKMLLCSLQIPPSIQKDYQSPNIRHCLFAAVIVFCHSLPIPFPKTSLTSSTELQNHMNRCSSRNAVGFQRLVVGPIQQVKRVYVYAFCKRVSCVYIVQKRQRGEMQHTRTQMANRPLVSHDEVEWRKMVGDSTRQEKQRMCGYRCLVGQ